MKNLTRSCTRLTLTSQQKLGDGGAQHESADFLGLGMPMPLCRGITLRYNRTSQRGQASYMIGWSLRRVRRSTGCRRCQARALDPQGMVGTEPGGKSGGH